MKKLLIITCCFFLSAFLLAQSNENEKYTQLLEKGDQYFEANNFKLAYLCYDSIFQKSDFYTARMLVRMANIKRRQYNDLATALYLLNVCYKRTKDEQVLKEIQIIAQKNDFQGYEYSDFDFFKSLYNRYNYHLLSLLTLIGIIVLVIRRKKARRISTLFSLLMLGSLIYFLNNYDYEPLYGITNTVSVNLYDIPSPGGQKVYELGENNRLQIIGQADIWYKVLWNKEEVFINKHEIKLIN